MTGLEWLTDGSPISDPEGRGERAVRALGKLRHPKSTLPGRAFQLDPPFERIVRRIYGPTNPDGSRQVRTVYLQVGKGSRKTSLAAALALLHTFGPERVAAGQNFVAAADRNQARIAFEEALSIVDATPALADGARPVDSKNRLMHLKTGSRFEAVSSDGKKKHGATPNFVLVDELWAHEKADLWHAMRTGATKVAGSLLVVATTAGRGNESPDFPIYEYARKVQAGEIVDPTFLPIVFEAGREEPWDEEATWAKVLPGLAYGYPDLASLRQMAAEARERPGDRAAFEQFFLGIRQDNSLTPYVDMRAYDKGARPIPEDIDGAPCWIGVDMSTTTDLTAVLACVRPLESDEFVLLPFFFVPENNLRTRADRDGVPYPEWAKQTFITPTPGNVIDPRAVEQRIRDLCERFDVREINFDEKYAQAVMGPLTDDGFPTASMRQGWVTQSPALNVLEGLILSEKIVHAGNPVLRWCFENIAIHNDSAGNRTMHKGKSRDRIDGATATWMAVSRAVREETSPYDRDDFVENWSSF
ncbi:MAG: terminase large subunit [Phreatobacter sp.]|uniref:terminase large subunit n=1 Tax=Phreatobacter sp. TaxID=1966341 RepID=UPI001A5F589F|nr:terminase TerL endonuclease subunit [Phreatobacter sp.]MBL8570946.1 terminase large subunit [Phreatobacter sp.]